MISRAAHLSFISLVMPSILWMSLDTWPLPLPGAAAGVLLLLLLLLLLLVVRLVSSSVSLWNSFS